MDVDCVIETVTYAEYTKFEEKLRLLGFFDDTTFGAPLCRKKYKGILVDVMPVNPDILGFSNRWYKDGMANKTTLQLPDTTNIFVFPVEYYIATKFEALKNRGGTDIRGSHDWEDIVYVITNCPELYENIRRCKNAKLTDYLKEQLSSLLQNDNIREIIYSVLPLNSPTESIDEVLNFMCEVKKVIV